MFNPGRREINIGLVITVFALLMGITIGNLIATSPVMVPILFAAGCAIGLLTLVRTDYAIGIIILSMLLSPELEIAKVPARAVVVRVEDILLIVVFFSWLAKMALNRQLGLLRRTPLNAPIWSYIMVCVMSTAIGAAVGDIKLSRAVFFILKYIEYFLLFYIIANNVRNERQVRIFIFLFIATYVIVCLYGYTLIGTGMRVTGPFEGEFGEPNTLSGYLMLVMAVLLGLFLYADSIKMRLAYGALVFFGIIPFLYTLSRAGYFSFIAMYLALIGLTERKRPLLLAFLVIAVIFSIFLLPDVIEQRIVGTFKGEEYAIFGTRLRLEPSAAARVESWKYVLFQAFPRKPLLGYGISWKFMDAQYITVLSEVGLIGAVAFMWMLLTAFRSGINSYRSFRKESFAGGLCIGYMAGFFGLLAHAITANTFIIVRIMEPFWFLTAIVIMLPQIARQPQMEVK